MVPLRTEKINANFEDVISKEFLTPLEEARLAIEEIVIAKNMAVDLFPRPSFIRKQQHELISHYHLTALSVGKDKQRSLRIYPSHVITTN